MKMKTLGTKTSDGIWWCSPLLTRLCTSKTNVKWRQNNS